MSDPGITREPSGLTTVRDHWWWRPGWRTGRHFYACHLTLDDQPQLRELVRGYQHATQQLAFLDQIPPDWLHITMQGIGFVDEISEREIAGITASLKRELAGLSPPTTVFQYPTIQTEAVYLRAHPAEPLYQLRLRMHHAVLSALGPDRFPEPGPSPEQFTPHVSTAYVNTESPADPLAAALNDVQSDAVTTTFRKASLLVFHRDNRMYEWTSATPIPIGTAAAEDHSVQVAFADGIERWTLTAQRRDRDWALTITGPDRSWTAEGPDMFEALRELRRTLDPLGIRIAVNGARRDAWASGMQRDMGEGRVVYLLTEGQTGRPPQVRTLGSAPLDAVGTVDEQDQQYAAWLAWRRTAD